MAHTIRSVKHVMFMWGRRGPFEAQWDPAIEDCPRIDVGNGMGLVLPDDAPEHVGAHVVADRYDMAGRKVGIAQCRVV
jgi:hypothetical protein